MGAWIEIKVQSLVNNYMKSLPLWERGLKLYCDTDSVKYIGVAPLVGAWIEMCVI